MVMMNRKEQTMSRHKYRNYITHSVITNENATCENCAYWKQQEAPHKYCNKSKKHDFCGEFERKESE